MEAILASNYRHHLPGISCVRCFQLNQFGDVGVLLQMDDSPHAICFESSQSPQCCLVVTQKVEARTVPHRHATGQAMLPTMLLTCMVLVWSFSERFIKL